MYQFTAGDLIICKPAEEMRSAENKDFEVYARVIDVDRTINALYVDAYLKQGRVHMAPRQALPLADCENYFYQPMNKKEIEEFIGGLFTFCSSREFSYEKKEVKKAAYITRSVAVEKWLQIVQQEEEPEVPF